ncbi:MAG: ABC transporter permease, partial [Treponema sp.]|nr:ABC transporter permease [Treponema sp.]
MKSNIPSGKGAMLALLITAFCIAGFFLPFDYNAMNSEQRFTPPGIKHLMGTDNFGRDVLHRIMAGAKYTLLTALLTVAGSAATGSALGMVSGYAGGLLDELVIRLMDTLNSFPGILLALVMVSLMGNSQITLIIALLILFIPGFTRIMRNGMLRYKNRDFILAARIAGVSGARIIFVHIFPNLLPSLLSASVLGLSNAILAESTMSYLGLGIQPPIPSWGRMLSESQVFLSNAPWCAMAPGLMIMLTVLAFHHLGESLKNRTIG